MKTMTRKPTSKITKRKTKIFLEKLKGNVGKYSVNGDFSIVSLITNVDIYIIQFYYKIIILKLHI